MQYLLKLALKARIDFVIIMLPRRDYTSLIGQYQLTRSTAVSSIQASQVLTCCLCPLRRFSTSEVLYFIEHNHIWLVSFPLLGLHQCSFLLTDTDWFLFYLVSWGMCVYVRTDQRRLQLQSSVRGALAQAICANCGGCLCLCIGFLEKT